MLEKIYVNEYPCDNIWKLSFDAPEVYCQESITVDEQTAKEILHLQNRKQSQDVKLPGEDEVLEALNNIKI